MASVLQAAEAELDAATNNSDLKIAARHLMHARRYRATLLAEQSETDGAKPPTPRRSP